MKIGEFERFNPYCGIAKVQQENGEEWFVVYGDYISTDHELGSVIGKGKTREEALIDGFRNYNKFIRRMELKIENFSHSLQGISFDNEFSKTTKGPVLAIEVNDFNPKTNNFDGKKKTYNANVRIDSDKIAYLGSR